MRGYSDYDAAEIRAAVERDRERTRLERLVVEAAKEWRDGDEYVLNKVTRRLLEHVERLVTFESAQEKK